MSSDRLCLECNSKDCRHVLPGNRPEVLSETEVRLLRLVADGETNKVIAHQFGSTEAAVKQSLHRVYRKLRLNSAGNPRVRITRWVSDHQALIGGKAA